MKQTPIASRSPSRRATLERKADQLIQDACRLMYRGRCIKCLGEGHAGHHIVKRRNKDLRHKIMNVVYLCHEHHAWAESDPAEFLDFLRLRWPAIYRWHIEHRSDPAQTITCQMLQDNIDSLKQLILRLASEHGQ